MRSAIAVIPLITGNKKYLFVNLYLLLLFWWEKILCKTEKGLTKYRWYYTHTSSGLAHYLLCGDSLSTNFLLMKADCYNTSTNGTLDFDNALCIRVCIEQPLISATWTSYVYFFLHDSALQSHNVIIWRAKSAISFRFDWNFSSAASLVGKILLRLSWIAPPFKNRTV